jgi:hypothetical protein
MDERGLADPEIDPRFPSGPWTGFFLQYWFPGRNSTNLEMSFHDGRLAGDGRDWVGPYVVDGTYDVSTGRCEWTKKYIGRHSVGYRGVNDGHGIWGVWELPQLFGLFVDRGGFHLWPNGTDVSEESARTEQAVLATMRAEFGPRTFRLIRALVAAVVALAVALLILWRWKS